jgi:hypothetical protein
MKRVCLYLIVLLAGFVVLPGCLVFCDVGCGEPVTNVSVCVKDGYSLEKAVLSAAARRQWMPEKISSNILRLTIRQRSNICSVDVVMQEDSFSVNPVASNITVRKYNQWVANLVREIIHRASRGL